MIHELKTVAPLFHKVLDGVKTFDIRKNDRNFEVGHYLWLREYDQTTKTYSGRNVHCIVTYILFDHAGLSDDYVVMAIRKTHYEL